MKQDRKRKVNTIKISGLLSQRNSTKFKSDQQEIKNSFKFPKKNKKTEKITIPKSAFVTKINKEGK